VLHCLRPWYSPALYQADDWRLSTNATLVSKGNGNGGTLPAYVDAVYLVSVKNITTEPKPPPPRPDRRPTLRPFGTTDIVRAELFQPKSLGDAGPSMGVVKKAVNTPMALRAVSTSSGSLPPQQVSSSPRATAATAGFTAMNLGQVRMVTAVDLDQRYTVAQAVLARIALPTRPPPEETTPLIYVAGFGCEKIPFAPNPNVNYQW